MAFFFLEQEGKYYRKFGSMSGGQLTIYLKHFNKQNKVIKISESFCIFQGLIMRCIWVEIISGFFLFLYKKFYVNVNNYN